MLFRTSVLCVNKFIVFLTLVLCCSLVSCNQGAEKEARTPKAVFIIVDGIPADVIEKLNPPTLAAISKAGGFTRAYVGGQTGTYTETPTISAVGYNSLLTGTWVNKHNVWDNDIAEPNYHYKDIFRIAEEYNKDLQTAVFSTWTDNRTKLIGEGLPQTGKVMLDYKFDGLELDTIKYPHDEQSEYIRLIDEAVSDQAARHIREHGPDLSWVYLQYTDDMGHRFGDSEQFYEAIRLADRQVGKVWEAIKHRDSQFDEDWLIIITTDHGRDATTGKHHGGQSTREKLTWIATNASDVNERFQHTPAVVDIMPSICNYLGIEIPDPVKKEIDGVPFIGPVDFCDLQGEIIDGKISLRWKSLGAEKGKADVLIANTNAFVVGGEDQYQKAGEVDISAEAYSFEHEAGGELCKVLLKGPNHYANVWLAPRAAQN